MNNTLESSRFFPVIAWTLVIGFAFFTYSLTTRLQSELSDIGDGVSRLETKINNLEAQKATDTTSTTVKAQ